jgi:DNA-binding XRE family transcriptional regulator
MQERNPLAIKQARHKRGLNQKELARLAGLTRNTIIALEQGEGSDESVTKVAIALKEDPAKFYRDRPTVSGNVQQLTPRQREFLAAVHELPDKDLAELLAYVKGFAEAARRRLT